MKYIYKSVLLILFTLTMVNCAKPSEPASVEGSLVIDHIFQTLGYARDVSVTDTHLFVAEDQVGFTIYDLATDDVVSHHESFLLGTDPVMFENVRGITAVDEENLLFVYNQYGSYQGIIMFDITNKVSPEFLFRHTGNTSSIAQIQSDVSQDGGADVYWTNGSGYNFGRFDEFWQGSNSYSFQNSIEGFDLDENRLYIAAEQLGFHIVNRSNGDIISTTDTEGEVLDVKIVDNYAVLALRQAGFAIYDISNTSQPSLVIHQEMNEYIYTIDIEDDQMVLGSHNGGVYLYNISDIADPALVGNIDSDEIGYTYKAVLKNNKIYASTRKGVYKIITN